MWSPVKTKKYGVAIYNWKGEKKFALPLDIGDTVQILEECGGWYRGFLTKNRNVKGIFPASYIHLKLCKQENESLSDVLQPVEDAVVREVTLVLREWQSIWKQLYIVREAYKVATVRKVMCELVDWRRQLLSGALTLDQTTQLKVKITSKIDWGHRKLGLDLVPRCGPDQVDPSNMSLLELYQVHSQSSENSMGASSRGTLRKKEVGKAVAHQVYLVMRDFGHSVSDTTEVYLSLYDAMKSSFLSERFLVTISKDGFSNYIETLNSNCTLFADLGRGELNKELYLVAQVFRIGRMLPSDQTKNKLLTTSNSGTLPSPHQNFKRPLAVGVFNIGEVVCSNEEKEFSFKVYQGEERDHHQLHDMIIRKQTSKFSPLPGQPNYGIVMSGRVLDGDVTQVQQDNPLLLKNISITRKLGFPDVIMPGDLRNDLYVTLEKGEFERGGKSTAKNIEVTLLVLDADGSAIEESVFGASGMNGRSWYRSAIIYHHNSPAWGETARLTVPIDKFSAAHIRLEYRHCSTREKSDNKKLLGFSFARLMEISGATIQDGVHELVVYRCEESTRLKPSLYLPLASSIKELHTSQQPCAFQPSPKESLTISTLLCSTKLTQNVELVSLLEWKARPERIQEALQRALRLDGSELVKFLQDVLDALFAMFSTEDGNSTSHSGLVFHVLVSILSLLDDPKFRHFKPVMDAYIKDHFAAALVYKGLLSSVQHCADWTGATDKQESIQKCFRCLESIFKFIVESRLLFSRATNGQYEESFKRDLYTVLASLNQVLASTNPHILETQVGLVESMGRVYSQVSRVLGPSEIARLVCSTLDTLLSRQPPPSLLKAKLRAIDTIVSSNLFTEQECRSAVLGVVCRHLRLHLAHREELDLITEILGKILTALFHDKRIEITNNKVNNCLQHDVEVVCLSTLDMLIQTVLLIIDKAMTILGKLVVCLISVLQLMNSSHYQRLCGSMEPKPLKELILRFLLVLHDLIKQQVYSDDWLVMRMSSAQVVLSAVCEISNVIFNHLQPPFDYQVWSNYFNLAVAFLTQPSLQLENFSPSKREKILSRYGDMRVQMGFQILKVWSNLGEGKMQLVGSMVGPFLEMTLVPEPELRRATLHIFFDMIQCEFNHHGNFKQVETELIDKLDTLISENKGDEEYRHLFNTILVARLEEGEVGWKESGWVFVQSVTRLLERLLDYRSVIHGDENRDKRMSCTVSLLNFYKNEINRAEMYVRYIYKLHVLHQSAENYTEAGFTLLLYANTLTWDKDHVTKLHLYHQILNYFDKAKMWEKGLPLLKELAHFYEERLLDYEKLGDVLRTQARFYDSILHQLRPEPEYFRVGFYGLAFPMFVRNKVFVYRGLEYERIETFTQRIQTEFPMAQVYAKSTPPSQTLLNSEAQYIQICNVKPLGEGRVWREALCSVPERIARYYRSNDVSRFQLDRPVHKGPIDKENEFKSLWLERTLLTTSQPLPGILRWFEVVHQRTEEVPPVRFACEAVQQVNSDLSYLINQYTQEPKRHTNPLSMRLQGVIDANVMGGIAKYQGAFFSHQFISDNPQWLPHVTNLSRLLQQQIEILETGLVVHGQLAPADMHPLHCRLRERLDQIKESLLSSPLIHSPSVMAPETEEYTNSIMYSHLSEDAYSYPEEVIEKCDVNDGPIAVLKDDDRLRWSRHIPEIGGDPDKAPPLPPRAYTPDRRSSSDIPPAPPKRVLGRKECERVVGRDSGYSEHSLEREEWSPRIPHPPILPPKTNQDTLLSGFKSMSDSYSVPRSQNENTAE